MNPQNTHGGRRSKVIRNAVILGLTALAIYAVFIMLVADRGPGALG